MITVYHSPELAGLPDDAPCARPPRAVEDREEEHVRTFLRALRPDHVDKMHPAPPVPTALPSMRARDPRDGWGGCPPGIDAPDIVADDRVAAVVHVMGRLRALEPDARAVCTWLRAFAKLEPGALRALYVDVGNEFAGAAQRELWERDIGAHRDGAYQLGRHLVLEAARAWGLRDL